ncbi:alpha/beta hydrolase [Saccharopolyspora sp. 5N708]|uniref:alpha/beta hydrolase n=1 Tax=Saccharopolyspora sp. 5N708 TaxID=3457424 RepID=UPI003FCFD232
MRLFPDRVRALYVDGAVDHLADPVENAKVNYQTIEDQFARLGAWCVSSRECALHGRDVGALWRGLVADADRSPIPVRGEEVAYSGFDLKIAPIPDVISPGAAPSFPNWQRFAWAVDKAVARDASGFADYVEQATGSLKVPAMVGKSVTECPDGMGVYDYADFERLKAIGERVSPNFAGERFLHRLPCVGWPTPVRNPPTPLPADRLPPLLGAGTWVDHAYVANIVAHVPGSATVRFNGSGHALYLSGDPCTIAHANRYLEFRRLPPPGTTCEPPAAD